MRYVPIQQKADKVLYTTLIVHGACEE